MQAYACDMHMHVICAYAFDNTGLEDDALILDHERILVVISS